MASETGSRFVRGVTYAYCVEDGGSSGVTSRADASSTNGTTCADEKRFSVSSSSSENWCDDTAYHEVVITTFVDGVSGKTHSETNLGTASPQCDATAGKLILARQRKPSLFSMVSDGDDDLEVPNVQHLNQPVHDQDSEVANNRNLFATYEALDSFCFLSTDENHERRIRAATIIQAAARGSIARRRLCFSNPILSHSELLASLQPISVERLRDEALAIRKQLMRKRARKKLQKVNCQVSSSSPGEASHNSSSPQPSICGESGDETDSTRQSTLCSGGSSVTNSHRAVQHKMAASVSQGGTNASVDVGGNREDGRNRRHSRASTRKKVDHLVADAMRRMGPCSR